MRILIAEDEPVSRRALEAAIGKEGFDVVVASDGIDAWEKYQAEGEVPLAILDWMMPGMDGVEVCRRIQQVDSSSTTYVILLTARRSPGDIVAGLEAGADDYVMKPFDQQELIARIKVGLRVVELQRSLAERVKQLEHTLADVNQLQGLLPICSYCKKIRDDKNYWQAVESYIAEHSEAQFSHGICPDCMEKYVKPQLESLRASRAARKRSVE
ncbi:MAG: response regulator [Ignavibacteriales bacterium CG07_land_8_20_14_0_80_59_12]|nr:MAG: response regulator [Ignavibacteriales bacterium CG07_land_8_20_14_0_80_59_12]